MYVAPTPNLFRNESANNFITDDEEHYDLIHVFYKRKALSVLTFIDFSVFFCIGFQNYDV